MEDGGWRMENERRAATQQKAGAEGSDTAEGKSRAEPCTTEHPWTPDSPLATGHDGSWQRVWAGDAPTWRVGCYRPGCSDSRRAPHIIAYHSPAADVVLCKATARRARQTWIEEH